MKNKTVDKCRHTPENKNIIGLHPFGFRKVFFVNKYTQICERCGKPIQIKGFNFFRVAIAIFYLLLYLVSCFLDISINSGGFRKGVYSALLSVSLAGYLMWRFGYIIPKWETAKICFFEKDDRDTSANNYRKIVRPWSDVLKRLTLLLGILLVLVIIVFAIKQSYTD